MVFLTLSLANYLLQRINHTRYTSYILEEYHTDMSVLLESALTLKILLVLYQTLPSDEDCSIDTHVSFNSVIFLIITSVKVDTTSNTAIKNILS